MTANNKTRHDLTPVRVTEAGKLLGVSPQTVRRHIKSGKIKASKPGQYLIPIAEVDKLQLGGQL